MKLFKLLAVLSLSVCSIAFAADKVESKLYDWKVEKVLDGDTVKFQVGFLPTEIKPFLSVRVNGVDTPEKKPRNKCDKEDLLAQKASKFTKDAVAGAKSIKVTIDGWDKYGGRILGDVILDGKSLSAMLIQSGNAREYHGEAKQSWCN